MHQKVYLPPVESENYTNSTYEPQQTCSKPPLGGIIHVDSNTLPSESDKTDCVFHSSRAFAYNVSRIYPIGFGFMDNLLTVNQINNQITFFSSVTAQNHTVTLVPRYYAFTDFNQFVNDIVNALNTAPSGIVFASIFNGVTPRTWTLQGSNNFYIDRSSSAILNGMSVYGFNAEHQLALTTLVGPMYMEPALYLEIRSVALQKFRAVDSTSTSLIKPVALRVFPKGDDFDIKFYEFREEIHFRWRADSPLSEIDFQFFDDHGNKLSLLMEDPTKFRFTIDFIAEV